MFTLHAHSNFSLLEATIPVEELVDYAVKCGASFVSLTDTNSMYGLIQLAKIAAERNINPLLGACIDDPKDKSLNALFIAQNNNGYALLCKIITTRKLKDDFSLTGLLKQDLPDIIVITSSVELLKVIGSGSPIRHNLFAELILTEKQKRNTRLLFDFAKENNIHIVASHPAYFAKKEDYTLYKVMNAIRLGTTLDNLKDADLVDSEFYLRTSAELKQDWRTLPEAMWNAERIARSCKVDLGLGRYKFPLFSLPPGETSFSFLWKIAFRGLEERYQPITEQPVKRLQYELEVIDEMGFCDYFLIVWDLIREARSRGVHHIGRGSAANSLVAYCLGLTEVDPIKYNLYFERFLNRGRVSPPDVDLDFSWKERDEIIKYVYERYGYDKTAMISTTVTFRARSAFREVAKVFGISESEISKYSKFIPWTSARNLPDLAEKFPETRSFDFKDEPWKSIIAIASRLSSYPRHLSIHPSGIVIAPQPMTNYTALEFAKNKGLGLIITQPDMYSIEELGLIKIDLLSQRSLGLLKDTMRRINTEDEKRKIYPPGRTKEGKNKAANLIPVEVRKTGLALYTGG
jgi:DNA polymerase III alpha subunit